MKESARHLDAFEYFFSLGDKRTLHSVCIKFAVSRVSVSKWRKLFNWDERIDKRNKDIASKIAKKTDTSIIKDKAQYVNLMKAFVADAVNRFRGEPEVFKCVNCKHDNIITRSRLKCNSIFDVERAIKLHLLLVGEATEITEIQVQEKLIFIINIVVEKAAVYMTKKNLELFALDLKAGIDVEDEYYPG